MFYVFFYLCILFHNKKDLKVNFTQSKRKGKKGGREGRQKGQEGRKETA